MPSWLAPAVLAASVALAIRIDRWRRRAPRLAEPAAPLREVTVLLPVRDEEHNLADCVASLLSQEPVARVVIVDDGSADRTREIARGLAGASDRVAVLDAGELPPGWKGKVHALERGRGEVATPWVLATDADTRHGPGLVARALATARERSLDSLSVAGFQETAGLGEALLTPAVFALLDGVLGDWRHAADGTSAVANGQFFLVRAEALAAIGGLAGIRREALDDLALARALRGAGFRHGFFRAPDLLRVRMYQGWAETFRGWRRNLGAFFAGRPRALVGVLAVALAPVLLMLWAAAAGAWRAVGVLWAGGSAASTILRRGSGRAVAAGLLYPVDALALSLCAVLGRRDVARGRLAPWKGRPVYLDD